MQKAVGDSGTWKLGGESFFAGVGGVLLISVDIDGGSAATVGVRNLSVVVCADGNLIDLMFLLLLQWDRKASKQLQIQLFWFEHFCFKH